MTPEHEPEFIDVSDAVRAPGTGDFIARCSCGWFDDVSADDLRGARELHAYHVSQAERPSAVAGGTNPE